MTFTHELQTLPAQPLSALRILAVVDDPDASTADLARLVETDPVLSLQVMRLANSPVYGLGGTVSSAGRAVVLLGFTTVRALAVAAVCALARNPASSFAAGYWPHAIATAVGASLVAKRVSVPAGDAFSVGLLHDLGAAVLRRRDPDRYDELLDRSRNDRSRLLVLERRAYGVTHPEVGASALAEWNLPESFTRAVAQHHHPPREVLGSLGRVLAAGETLAQLLDDTFPYEPVVDVAEALRNVGLTSRSVDQLHAEMRAEIERLGSFLRVHA